MILTQAKTSHTEILGKPETQNLAIPVSLLNSNIDEKTQQVVEIIEKELKCPAQDKHTLKCYSEAFWKAKPGKAKVCIRPCEDEGEIKDWNKKAN